jgi:hypothetical protein
MVTDRETAITEDNTRAEQRALDALTLAHAQCVAAPNSRKAKAAYLDARERLAEVRLYNDARLQRQGGQP